MSCQNIVAAIRMRGLGLTSAEKLVLAEIANRANAAGFCWPSVSELAGVLELSTRKICEATERLESKNLIEVTRRRNQNNTYRLVFGTDKAKHNPGPKVIHKQQPAASDIPAPTQPAASDEKSHSDEVWSDKKSHPGPVWSDKKSHESLKKESTKKEQAFSDSKLEGSPPEREPTVAEIEARRKAAAAELRKVAERTPAVAAALGELGKRLHGVAYAPGRSPQRSVEEQIDSAKPKPRVEACPLPPDLLARMPHRRAAYAREMAA